MEESKPLIKTLSAKIASSLFKREGKIKVPVSQDDFLERAKEITDAQKRAEKKKANEPFRSADYNLGIGDKVLIILAQTPSHLGGVETIKDDKWYGVPQKDISNRGYSRKELISIREKIKREANGEYHKLVADFQKKYKSQVLVYDLSWYDLGKKHNLDYKSTFTLQQAIEGKEYRQDFSELIKMMNEAEHLIYIGEAHKGLDFDLFIDDFSTSVVITDDENIQLKETDYLKVIRGISLERVKALLDVTKLALEPFNISYEKPFDDELLKKVKEIWEDRTKRKKHFMEVIDAKSVKKINEIYPFTKELPDIVSEALWNVYAKDTTRASLIDRPQREDFFIDIVLMYTLFDWKSPNEYLTKRPKVSLLKAVTEANKRDIMRFHNLIKKNSLIDKAIN